MRRHKINCVIKRARIYMEVDGDEKGRFNLVVWWWNIAEYERTFIRGRVIIASGHCTERHSQRLISNERMNWTLFYASFIWFYIYICLVTFSSSIYIFIVGQRLMKLPFPIYISNYIKDKLQTRKQFIQNVHVYYSY